MFPSDLTTILPELVLASYGLAALMWAVFSNTQKTGTALVWLTSIFLVGLSLWIGLATTGTKQAFGGAFVDDGFSRFAKVVIALSSAVVLLLSRDYLDRERILKFEFPILVVFAVLGMMIMVSAHGLMVLYMGIELQSLSLYVLAAFHRNHSKSTEAGLKYFVLGALSSGLLLYGASLTYGFSGTTLMSGISEAISDGETSVGLLFGLAFLIVGLAFKVSAAPFHMWAPDVYEGAPTPVTLFLATAPKVAAMILFARLLMEAFGPVADDWQLIIGGIAFVSMFLGSIAAIGQIDIKRLMAYSSIAHMGYALMGIASGTEKGFQAMLIYMVIYTIMNLGTFAFILSMRKGGRPVSDIYSLGMYSKQAPVQAFSLLLLMFSLAGIVPLIGFFAKLYVFLAVIEVGMYWLALGGAIASVIGAYYYLRLVYFMYFGEEGESLDDNMTRTSQITLVLSGVFVVVGVANLFGIIDISQAATGMLFN